jgi:hypothetical protein
MRAMIIAGPSPAFDMSGHDARQDSPWKDSTATPDGAPPKVSPELIARFKALVEDVTDELMQDQANDRPVCRADAIALLVATCEQFEQAEESVESPLRYFLMQEQHQSPSSLHDPGAPSARFIKV